MSVSSRLLRHRRRLNVLLGLVVGLGFMSVGGVWARKQNLVDAHRYVCEMVAERSLFGDLDVGEWLTGCLEAGARISVLSSKKDILDSLQDQMDLVGVSHLRVYGPVEDKRLWQGRARETGITTWEINGRFIVDRVVPGSAADRAGIVRGDLLLEAGGSGPVTRWQVQSSPGKYKWDRQGKVMEAELVPTEISIDQSPQLTEILLGPRGSGKPVRYLLKISSFRSEYFDADKWKAMLRQIYSSGQLIIDLRDNYGGNFVAMLRALSPFVCGGAQSLAASSTDSGIDGGGTSGRPDRKEGGQDLGRLIQPRRTDEGVMAFADDANDVYQIEHIEKYKEVPLTRFEDYGCYNGNVVVLANHRTSSVAEIFAEAIRANPRHVFKGEPTAGDVVLAIWYGLSRLGSGYSFSIPEAIFETPDGSPLEGVGVQPEVQMFYDLNDAIEGRDTWVEDAF